MHALAAINYGLSGVGAPDGLLLRGVKAMVLLTNHPIASPQNSKAGSKLWYPFMLIAPTMITLVIVSLIPFLFTVYLSLHKAKFGRVTDFVGLENYLSLFAMHASGIRLASPSHSWQSPYPLNSCWD